MGRAQKKANFDRQHKKQANLDFHSQTNSISIPHIKPCYFRPQHWNQVSFDVTTQKPSQFRPLHRNQVSFDPPHWNWANLDHPHKNEVTQLPSLKTSHFRPAHKKIKVISIPTVRPSQRRSPDTESESISTIHTKSKSIPTPALNWSQFWCPTLKWS